MLHGSALFAVKILSEVFNLLLGGKIPTAAFNFFIFQHCHNFVLNVFLNDNLVVIFKKQRKISRFELRSIFHMKLK